MNIVDYVIIGIIGISVLFGLYRGFIASVLNMGCGLMSFLASFWVSPKLAAAVQSNQSFLNMLLHYTDASSRIGDLETAITNVATLTSQSINSILEKVNLPAPLDTLLRVNLENNVYASSGLSTVSDYVSQTILQASINIICFLVSFLVLYIVLAIVLNLLKAVFRFPVLKQLNGLAGGAFGFLRGLLVCLVLFTLVPLVQTVIPLDMVKTEQGPGYGAAMLAMVGCGKFASVQEAADALVETASTTEPDAALTVRYEARYQNFKKLYPALKEFFAVTV